MLRAASDCVWCKRSGFSWLAWEQSTPDTVNALLRFPGQAADRLPERIPAFWHLFASMGTFFSLLGLRNGLP